LRSTQSFAGNCGLRITDCGFRPTTQVNCGLRIADCGFDPPTRGERPGSRVGGGESAIFNPQSVTKKVAILCVAVVATFGCGPGVNTQDVEFRIPVTVQDVVLGTVEDRIVATGSLRPAEVVTLVVETSGVLEIGRGPQGRRLGEGDRVRAGQVVAQITGEDARLAAHTAATRQRFEAADSDYQATLKLFEQGLITDTELRSAETRLEDARLEYDRSRHTETRNSLVTPIDGVILSLARDQRGQPLASGQLVNRGLVVAEVAPTDDLVADVDLVGPDVARVRVGLEARIRHHAWEDRLFDGVVYRMAPTIDPITRALRAEVEVDNRDGLLRPGMFVEVTVVGTRREGVPVVPRVAVTDRGGKRVVFLLKGQRVTRTEVELGLGDDEIVEIAAGVVAGDKVVVRGLETLTDQTRVRVTGSSS
jgi:membrane fusion protein (multidrug efflux system)